MNMLNSSGSGGGGGSSSSCRTTTRTLVGTAVVTTANMQIHTSSARSRNSLNRLLHLLTLWIWLFCINFGVGDSATQVLRKDEPVFISQSEAFKFAVGDTITLPCEVTQPGGNYVLAWKRGIAILTAAAVKVTPDPRVRLGNQYTLHIKDAVESDAGDYICQIATLEPREITHHVEILVPPKIHHVTSGGHLQVRKGSPVRLECSASGNPAPNITWTRKNNLLPNGEDKYVNSVYIIENMDRHKGGVYICTANNGVGQVATSQVNLHVLFPPEIIVEKPVVYAGNGREAVLLCIVHGETPPEVTWYKDTMQIDQTERFTTENTGARHTLTIRKVTSAEYGNYSCVADNQLGKSRKTITLSCKPQTAAFLSTPLSQWKDKYNISWFVESPINILEHKLYYRMLNDDSNEKHAADSNYFDKSHQIYGKSDQGSFNTLDLHDKQQHNPYSSYTHQTYPVRPLRNEWHDIRLPSLYHQTSQVSNRMSHVIRGLETDQQYEAKVQSRNDCGWSDLSERFLFSTSHTDTEIRDLGVVQYGASSSNSITVSNTIKQFVMVIGIILFSNV